MFARHENRYLQLAETAYIREKLARILWNSIEKQCDLIPNDINFLRCNSQYTAEIIEIWDILGVIVRNDKVTTSDVRLRTRIDELTEGRCHNCGVQGKGRKELFFKSVSCQKCGGDGFYFIIYPDTQK